MDSCREEGEVRVGGGGGGGGCSGTAGDWVVAGRTGPGEEGVKVWVVREEITVDIRRFPAYV